MLGSPVAVEAGTRAHELQRALDTLYEVGRVLSRSLDLRETMGGMLRAMDQGGLYGGLIALQDAASGELVVEAGMGLDARRVIRYSAGEGVVGRVVATGDASFPTRPAKASSVALSRPAGKWSSRSSTTIRISSTGADSTTRAVPLSPSRSALPTGWSAFSSASRSAVVRPGSRRRRTWCG